ncbi:Uncharacterized protein APZ42_024829 [Daphnia magna]|uniref:Uncharacterized protein n=1 Tax=Daphnia magna TaxID=35525 RepID=A0A164TR04_9CRUS|nr:Uncharacterized protein APZ42_024829 [Daphnia magna]
MFWFVEPLRFFSTHQSKSIVPVQSRSCVIIDSLLPSIADENFRHMRSLTHENITIDFFFCFIVEICSRANRVKPVSVRELHTTKRKIMRRVTASADDGCVAGTTPQGGL